MLIVSVRLLTSIELSTSRFFSKHTALIVCSPLIIPGFHNNGYPCGAKNRKWCPRSRESLRLFKNSLIVIFRKTNTFIHWPHRIN